MIHLNLLPSLLEPYSPFVATPCAMFAAYFFPTEVFTDLPRGTTSIFSNSARDRWHVCRQSVPFQSLRILGLQGSNNGLTVMEGFFGMIFCKKKGCHCVDSMLVLLVCCKV